MLMYRDVYTSYYQWVPPFLIASACLFYLPRLDQPIIIIFFYYYYHNYYYHDCYYYYCYYCYYFLLLLLLLLLFAYQGAFG